MGNNLQLFPVTKDLMLVELSDILLLTKNRLSTNWANTFHFHQ